MIKDTRPCATQPFHILSEEDALIYDICDSIHSLDSILIRARKKYPNINREYIKESLASLINDKIMLNDKGNYLSIAVKINR